MVSTLMAPATVTARAEGASSSTDAHARSHTAARDPQEVPLSKLAGRPTDRHPTVQSGKRRRREVTIEPPRLNAPFEACHYGPESPRREPVNRQAPPGWSPDTAADSDSTDGMSRHAQVMPRCSQAWTALDFVKGASQPAECSHRSDEADDTDHESGFSRRISAGLVPPKQIESCTMPAQHPASGQPGGTWP